MSELAPARRQQRGVKQAAAAQRTRTTSQQAPAQVCKGGFVGYLAPSHEMGLQIGRIGMRILRTATLAAVSAVVFASISVAPAFAADPVGTWLTGDKKGKVKIVNCGGAICGSLVWMQEPNDPETHQPKTDKHNSDASKQGRPLIGIPIVLSMKPNGADAWQGQVYNAEDGGTYTGSFTMTGANSADLKGCVMGGLICKSQTWTRSN